MLGFWLTWMRRYDKAERWLTRCLEMTSESSEGSIGSPLLSVTTRATCLIDLGHVQWMKGEFPEAWSGVEDPYVQ
jgi:hypothetical protein